MRCFLVMALAVPVFAQDRVPLDKPGVVRMVLKDAPAMGVLETIVSTGGYSFVAGALDERKVTVILTGVSIRQALETVTKVTGLEYRVDGNIVSVFGEPQRSEETRVYEIHYAPVGGPDGLERTLTRLFTGAAPEDGDTAAAAARAGPASGSVRIQADAERRRLIVTALPSVHRQVAELVEELDARAGVRALRDMPQ